MKYLFILKQSSSYGSAAPSGGLFTSTKFIVDMLNAAGREAALVEVVDNNDIDREVTSYRPTHVFIEALWVVPSKFYVLRRLHPTVKWIIHIHSNLPFLANEGIAMDWLFEYLAQPNIFIAFNSERIWRTLGAIVPCAQRLLYLPNYYPTTRYSRISIPTLNIGCFGAVRPMKNQLLQAAAAIEFADQKKEPLRFHINSARTEQGGDAVLKNLRGLFAGTRHTLVEHPWLEREDFLNLLRTMHYCLAVSLSETFCIIAADTAATSIPLVCSPEIPWVSRRSIVPATDADAIVRTLTRLSRPFLSRLDTLYNEYLLTQYAANARKRWLALNI